MATCVLSEMPGQLVGPGKAPTTSGEVTVVRLLTRVRAEVR